MTVGAATLPVTYILNGATTAFAIPFYFLEDTHLRVSIVDGGVETVLALTTDYTADGAGEESGGTLHTTLLYSSGTLVINRDLPYEQETQYPANTAFPSSSHERALDYLTMCVQQLSAAIGLTLQMPKGYVGVSNVLPPPDPSSLVGWNADGTALENVGPSQLGDGQVLDVNISPNANIQASKLAFLQPETGAVTRSVKDRLADTISVLDFMTPAQIADVRSYAGSMDVTAAVQAALSIPSAKRVYFPSGSYKLSSALAIPASTYLLGDGPKATFLEFTLPSGSSTALISINADHTETWFGGGISRLSIIDSTPSSDNTAVYVESVNKGEFADVFISGANVGYQFNGVFTCYVKDNLIGDFGGDAAAAKGLWGTNGGGVEIFNTLVQSSVGAGWGYYFDAGCSPTMFRANTFGCVVGCRINATGATTLWPELIACQFDTGSDTGLLIDAGTGGVIEGVSLVDLWAATNSSNGVHISTTGTGKIDGVYFHGGRVFNNSAEGILLDGGTNISVNGVQVAGNGATTRSGITVNAAVTGLNISGCRIGPEAGFTSKQTYGIQLQGFAISGVIAGNDLSGNITDGVVNGATSPNAVSISGNKGYSLNSLVAPTLANGWANNGGATSTAGYWIDGSGTVHVRGLVKSGTLGSAAFTLPAGLRPATDQYFANVSNGAFGYTIVHANGDVVPFAGSTTWFSLCGISFKAEQ